MSNKPKLSIIVPCFNEEEALPFFYKEITKVLKPLKISYEIILVDDGSKDNTLKVMKNYSKKDNHILYISFSRNFGKESAMYAGLCNSKGKYVGFIDADLQHPPILLKQMIQCLDSNNEIDCVACRRVNRKGDSKIRTAFSRCFYKVINIFSEVKMTDGAGDYRLMRRNVVDSIVSMKEHNRFSKGIFSWIGYRTHWIDYENVDRVAGKTSWSFTGLIKYAIDGLTNYSNVPLNISIYLGFLTTFLAFVYLLFIIIKYTIYGDPVQGWATTICVILFIGGVQLFSLGIIGQYIGKMYIETKNRPHYIIKNTNIK